MLSSYVRTARLGGKIAPGIICGQQAVHGGITPARHGLAVMCGGRRPMATALKPAARAWIDRHLANSKKFLDHNPFVKLSLYGTAVLMTILVFVDYLMKGKRKAGPRPVSMLPYDCGGYTLPRDEEVAKLLALFGKFELSWKGSARVVGVEGPPLCGKTELLRQLATAWQLKEGSGMFISCTPAVVTIEAHDTDDVIVQLHQAAQQLGCLAGDVIEGGAGDAFAKLAPDEQISQLCEAIRLKLAERGHWLFIVDGDVARRHLSHLLPAEGSQSWGKGVVVYAGDEPTTNGEAATSGSPADVYKVAERLSPSQALELLLASCAAHHNSELLRVNFGSRGDEMTAAAERLCEVLGRSPMATALAGSLIRWRQSHDQASAFWFNECTATVLDRCRTLSHDLQGTVTPSPPANDVTTNGDVIAASGEIPDPALALVAITSLLAEEILSVGQQRSFQQQSPPQQHNHQQSNSSDTFVRESLAALGWLAADGGPVAVAFLRQHMQHPDFDMERAREQQLLQQRKELEMMQQQLAAASTAASTSSSGRDLWGTMKSALPFGMGTTSSSGDDGAGSGASDEAAAASGAGGPGSGQLPPSMGGADVVDDILTTMKDYHLVRRNDVSDCSVVRMTPVLATAVRRDHMLHGAERAENRHVSRESAGATMKSQWGQRMHRFDSGRCRLEYRKSLQTQLDRHKGNSRLPSRLSSLLKYVDGVLERSVPEAASIRAGLVAASANEGSSKPSTRSTATSATSPSAHRPVGVPSPVATAAMPSATQYTVQQLDEIRGNVAAADASDTFLRLHRQRLLAAIATTVDTCPDTVPGRVLRRYAMPAHARVHQGGAARLDGGRDLWTGVSAFTVGERGRMLALRAQIMSRCYRLAVPSIALLRESAECCGKAYGDRSTSTLNALNLLANELRSLSLAGSLKLTADTQEILSQIIGIEDTISPMSVSPDQASTTASTMFLLARLHADLGEFDESRALLERCLLLQQHILNTMEGHKYIPLYSSTLIDVGNLILSDGGASIALKAFSLAITLLRAVHGDNQVLVEKALHLQGAAYLLMGHKEKSRESRKQATGVKHKVDMAVLI